MKKPAPFILSLLAAGTVLAGDPFSGPDANQSGLADGVRLSARVVENVYLMPEQITKLIFPKAVEEVSVNTQVINIGRNPPDSKEYLPPAFPESRPGRRGHARCPGGQDLHVPADRRPG